LRFTGFFKNPVTAQLYFRQLADFPGAIPPIGGLPGAANWPVWVDPQPAPLPEFR
jgi:hypothetical protein